MAGVRATNLTVEYRSNPIGVDVAHPRISWRLEGEGRGIRQKAYRIQVAKDDQFDEAVVWDTGQVMSDQSVLLPYQGEELEPQTRYFVRVNVWDRREHESGWSETAYWETGMMSPERWSAKWISAGKPASEHVDEPVHYMRRAFSVQGAVKRARVYATARGVYKLRLNGGSVGHLELTPGWTSYEHRLQYQTFDVTHQLQQGSNMLGVMLADGWYKGDLGWRSARHLYGDQRAALVELHVEYEDGRVDKTVTDDTWMHADIGPILMAEIYHGETYDARLELVGWDRADASPSSMTHMADDPVHHHAAGAVGEVTWKPVHVIDKPKHVLIAQENEGTQVMLELKPVELVRTPKGETVLDFGQNMVGWVRFEVHGAESGQVIRLYHAEVLDREGNFYTENLRSAKQTITYVCAGRRTEVYEPTFTFQGFRYVKVEGYPGELDTTKFTGRVLYTAMKQTGRFECSHPLLNQLQSNIVWGQRGNFLDIPTDCPQRDERLGWTGDAQVFIRTAAFNMQTANFFAKWLRDLKADQREDGGVSFVVPNVLEPHAYCSAAWGDAATICPWEVYVHYGDVRILEEQYESMKSWVEYIRAQGEDAYLWNTGFHFGDWLGLDAKENSYRGATPEDLIATAFYAHSASLLVKAAKILGKEEDAQHYEKLHEAVVERFREEFVTPNGRIASPTQTAHVLALMFDLVQGETKARTIKSLAEMIKKEGIHLTTGFVGTPYICHVLSANGYNDLAYELVQQTDYPSWLYPVKRGATTIWEHWDGVKQDGSFWSADMNSFNHYAYGAIGDWMYRVMAGLDIDEQKAGFGYRAARIAPQPGPGIDYAEAALDTLYGEFKSGWRKDNNSMEVMAELPSNTSATVVLPNARLKDVLEQGRPLAESEGIVNVNQAGDAVLIEVESGAYRFHYPVSQSHVQ